MLDSHPSVNSSRPWIRAVLGAVLIFLTGCDHHENRNVGSIMKEQGPPTAIFTDITKGAGITFIHNNGAYGEKLLPESMGGGVTCYRRD